MNADIRKSTDSQGKQLIVSAFILYYNHNSQIKEHTLTCATTYLRFNYCSCKINSHNMYELTRMKITILKDSKSTKHKTHLSVGLSWYFI